MRQVEFVVKAGFTGAFFYIGNEDGAPQHAELIAAHARAMKKVDPTLKAFWNDNDLSPDHLTAFLKTAVSPPIICSSSLRILCQMTAAPRHSIANHTNSTQHAPRCHHALRAG